MVKNIKTTIMIALLLVSLASVSLGQTVDFMSPTINIYEELQGIKTLIEGLTHRLNVTERELQSQSSLVEELTDKLSATERELKEQRSLLEELKLEHTPAPVTPSPMTRTSLPCSEGWLQFKSTCYYISTNRMSWKSSQKYCTSRGGHLAILRTEDVQTFVWDQLPRGYWNAWWFGMSDEKVEGDWHWVDGTKLEQSFWQEDEPNNNGNNEDCSYIVKTRVLSRVATSSWNDAPCSMSVAWICEKPVTELTPAPVTPAPVTPAPVTPAPVTPTPVTPAPVTPAPPLTCSEGWIQFKSTCYFISTFTRTWQSSQDYCTERGGHLAMLRTEDVQTFVWDQLPRGYWKTWWFGISDEKVEGDWRWVDGTKLEQSFWQEDEPNNHDNNEDCGYIVKTNVLSRVATRSWNDAPCSMSVSWICEKPASVSP